MSRLRFLFIIISLLCISPLFSDDFFGRNQKGEFEMYGATLGYYSKNGTSAAEGSFYLGASTDKIPIELIFFLTRMCRL